MLLSSIRTFISLIHAPSTPLSVLVARATASFMASSKPVWDVALNSVTRATLIASASLDASLPGLVACLRVVLLVVGGMVADDVDHWCVGASGVVHVGQPVGESGPQVQKGRGGLVRHARVAVGRARHNALEQPEHAPYIPDLIERRDKVHLRGARVGEADLHPRAGQRLD